MTRFVPALLLAFVLVSVETEVALAQTQDEKTSDQVLEAYAECIVSRRSGKSSLIQKFLGIPIGETVPQGLAMRLVDADCLEGAGRMNMAPELFGRSLYSALYRRDFRKDEPSQFVPASSYDGEFDPHYGPISSNQASMRKIGDCAVLGNLSAAHRYVVAKVWSDEEAAVLPDVVSALSRCFGAGERIAFSHSMLKGILAESLYKYRLGITLTETSSL